MEQLKSYLDVVDEIDLTFLKQIAEKLKIEYTVEDGDVLVFSNSNNAHIFLNYIKNYYNQHQGIMNLH